MLHGRKRRRPFACRRRAFIYPGTGLFSAEGCPPSIVGAEAFHCRVRDGNGWVHLALATKATRCHRVIWDSIEEAGGWPVRGRRAVRPLGPLSCARCRACTRGPSATWSGWGLMRSKAQGGPILERASRLDAVSAYHGRTTATRRCSWQNNRSTGGPSAPVLSYWGLASAVPRRPRRIETELSHDVLNPARVPL